jgi:hypothetical protein
MNSAKILSGASVGTTAMTVFSYLAANAKGKQFREPELLEKNIRRLFPGTDKTTAQTEAWILHYAVGLTFVAAYDQIWTKTKVRPSFVSALVLGAVSGLIGMGVWRKVFDWHPDPPHVNLKRYTGHLMAAHLVFAGFALLGYKIPRKSLQR